MVSTELAEEEQKVMRYLCVDWDIKVGEKQ